MKSERYEQIRRIYLEACELNGTQREKFLRRVGDNDPELRTEVESLLDEESWDPDFLDEPALGSEFSLLETEASLFLPPLPDRLGPFRVERVLGGGSASVVLLVSDPRMTSQNNHYVLKMLRPGISSRDAIKRFEVECEALSALDHPHIASVLAEGQSEAEGPWGGRSFVALEYVQGDPITRYCARHELGLRQRLGIFVKICHAIQHAHQKGIIHRDLKPMNLLVQGDPSDPDPKVIDFGVARISNGQESPHSLSTRHGELLGTLAYMSPEQLSGDPKQVDTQSDIFALGSVLYELILGQPPVDLSGMTVVDAARRVADARPVSPQKIDPSIEPDLATIIRKAMEPDRTRRFSTVAELAADVQRYLEGHPILARNPSGVEELIRVARRHRVLVSTIALAVILLSIALVDSLFARQEARQNYLQAKSLTDAMLNYSLELSDVPGLAEKSVSILQHLHEVSTSMGYETSVLPADRRRHADIQYALANALIKQGAMDEAVSLHRQALDLRRNLMNEVSDPWLRMDVGLSLVRNGDLLNHRGDRTRALAFYEEAMHIDSDLNHRAPEVRRFADNLGWSLDRIALKRIEDGRMLDAERLVEQQASIAQDLIRTYPDDPRGLHLLHEAIKKFEFIDRRLMRAPDRRETTAQALAAAERLVQLRPGHSLYRRRHAGMLDAMAAIEAEDRNWSEAERLYRQALSTRLSLQEADPGIPVYWREIAASYSHLGSVLREKGLAIEEALKLTALAVEFARRGADLHPENPQFLHRLGAALTAHASNQIAAGRTEDSRQLRSEILEIARKLTLNSPDDVLYASQYTNLLLSFHDDALAEEALRHAAVTHSRFPEDPVSVRLLAMALVRGGQSERARSLLEDWLAERPHLSMATRVALRSTLEK